VLAGRDRGREGEIEKVLPSEGRAIVTGVNTVVRHTRQSQSSQGGRIPKSMPINPKWAVQRGLASRWKMARKSATQRNPVR